jgi:hypothetical protein
MVLPPLEDVVPTPAPGLDAPLDQPAFEAAQNLQPLAELGAVAEPERVPNEAFAVASAAITAVSGGRGDADWTPDKPLGTSGPIAAYIPPWQRVTPHAMINPPAYPQPGSPQWFGPGAAPAPEQVKPVAIVKRVFLGVTVPVLVCLLLGGLIGMLSPLMLLLSFLFSTRIAYRQYAVRQTYVLAGIVLGLVAATGLLYAYDILFLFESIASVAQPACWVVGAVLTVIIYLAISKDERPTKLPGRNPY